MTPSGRFSISQFDLAIETIAADHDDFDRHRRPAAEGDRFGEGIAITVAQFHVQRPADQCKIGLGFANDQAIDIAGVVTCAAEQIADLQSMHVRLR